MRCAAPTSARRHSCGSPDSGADSEIQLDKDHKAVWLLASADSYEQLMQSQRGKKKSKPYMDRYDDIPTRPGHLTLQSIHEKQEFENNSWHKKTPFGNNIPRDCKQQPTFQAFHTGSWRLGTIVCNGPCGST